MADGIDFQFDMSMDYLEGLITGDILWSHQLGNERVAFPGDAVDDLTGRYVGEMYAEDKISYKVAYMKDDWSISYLGEYISGVDSEILYAAGTQPIDSFLYHDIVGSYNVTDMGLRIAVGLTNITDEAPPYMDYGFNGGTDPSTYRLAGQSYYMRLTKSF